MSDHKLIGWKNRDGALHKSFVFKDFSEAFSFMTRVALEAERLNHHPDWSNSYNKVTISLTTHSKGEVTDLDYQLARRIDDIFNDN